MAVIFESDKHLQILDMIDKKDYLTPEYLAKQVKSVNGLYLITLIG